VDFEHSEESDRILLAQAYFQSKEFARAAHTLDGFTSSKAVFLRGYAKFLAGEKARADIPSKGAGVQPQSTSEWTQHATHHLAVQGDKKSVNQSLRSLRAELEEFCAKCDDGFVLYLYGIVLKEMDVAAEAVSVLQMAIKAYPCNWSAWQDLGSLCTTREMYQELDLPDHWMNLFFQAHMWLELQQGDDDMTIYATLESLVPNSTSILAQTAVAKYNTQEYAESKDLFEALQELDPHRLEGLETFSNILHGTQDTAALSLLAHQATRNDKNRPETCCIVGNYYSLKSEHEKAVLYFQQAIKLNPRCVSAWTLMGHEYRELKNTPAAVRAYRQAVEINSCDYRAWHGLGQTYEDLKLPFYSLYYYQKATELRPNDHRMWFATGNCYETLGKPMYYHKAVKCYERAEQEGDDGNARSRLASSELAQYVTHESGRSPY